jgi:nanoRNase/pAp phosphatase (c-di-AMP/oligoRNAs hydrolase)
MDISQQIKERLESAQTIALFGHQSVDGDALGAML